MNNIRFYILTAVIFVIQLLISEYVNIWPMLYIAVYPVLLIVVPYNTNRYFALIISFLFGLFIDITTGSILGLNAATATALTFFRNPIMNILFSKVSLEKIEQINEQSVGGAKFTQLSGLCYFVFFLFFIYLDGWGYTSFLHTLFRFVINIAANTLLAYILWKTLVIKMFR